jgi:hypothetical protein
MAFAADWRHLRKVLLGASLIVAPLLIAISDVISSAIYDGDNYRRYLASIADNQAAYYAGNLVGAIGAIFLIGAVLAIIHLIRVRHPRFALVAGGLTLLCVAMLPGVWLLSTVMEYEMARSADQAVFARFLDATEENASMIPLLVAWLGTTLGVLVLAGGLFWSRTVPRWMPALLFAGFVLLWFADEGVLGIGVSLVILAALGAIGATILRSSDEAWEAGELEHPAPPAAPTPSAPLPAH